VAEANQQGVRMDAEFRALGKREARHVFAAWKDIVKRLRSADRFLLLSDFDGTLVPIRARPEQVRLSAGLKRLLCSFAKGQTTLGIVSGRSLEDVRLRVGVPNAWYAGSHGYFIRDPQGRQHSLLSKEEAIRMKNLSLFLRLRFRLLPGLRVELKQ
jgi:alpha,alpha-trehalase